MKIDNLLSIMLIAVFAAGLIGCQGGETPEPEGGSETVATVNAKCPMPMGGKFDRTKVTTDLVRDFNGKKVGFCCAMCLPMWDKLSDAEKTEKLAAAMKP